MSQSSFRKAVFSGVALSALSLSGVAVAQDADVDEVVSVAEEADTQEMRQEKVVVTGSLLARDEFTSSSPVQVITAEVATLEGLVDAAELLQNSSLAAGSTQLNNTFQNFVTNGGVGTQTVDLRGCGDTRTLVLLDGKRPGPSGTRGAVSALDLSVVPQSIISRVEILKDGSSTTYGSDAVCGVINIITRDSVDGFELTGSLTAPEETGGMQYVVSAAYGFEMGDNADFTLSAEYRLNEEIDVSDRSYLDCTRDLVRDPVSGNLIDRLNQSATATDPNFNCSNLYHNTVIDGLTGERLVPSPDGITAGTAVGGVIPGYRPRVATPGVNPDGTLYYEDILDAPFLDNEDYYPRLENISIVATADVDFDNGMTWDTELLYSKRDVDVEGWRQFFPFVGSDVNALGNAPFLGYIGGAYDNGMNSLVRPVMPYPSNSQVTVDYYFGSTSLSGGFGDFAPDWSWKADATYSRGEGSYTNNQILISESGDWGLDGVADYTGDGVPDLVAPPSINFLDPQYLSGANVAGLVAAIGGEETGDTVYEQTTLTAIATGELFELPAGDVLAAVGVEYREFSIDDQPGALTQVGNVWGRSTAGPTIGENTVTELFGELELPIFAGAALAESLTLNLSGRTFSYDIGGDDSIYKVGMNWQINPVLRARASTGTSYRAPALFELFLQDQTGFVGQTAIDPCVDWGESTNQNIRANCAAAGIPDNYAGAGSSATVITSGGGDLLKSEESETFTAGIVYTPTFADINIALDYYEVEITDQITTLGGGTIVGGCYAATDFPNDFCNLFERAPATDPAAPFRIDNVQARTLNVDSQQQRGIDLEVRWTQEFDFGDLTFDASFNWALERYINVFGSDFISGVSDLDFNGTVGYPSVVGDTSLRLDRGDWTFTWFTDFVGRQDNNRNFSADLNEESTYFGLPALYKVYTEAEWRHGLSVRWVSDTWSITGGVINLFGEEPPQVSDQLSVTGNTPNFATAYDVRGRRAFVNVSKSF